MNGEQVKGGKKIWGVEIPCFLPLPYLIFFVDSSLGNSRVPICLPKTIFNANIYHLSCLPCWGNDP